MMPSYSPWFGVVVIVYFVWLVVGFVGMVAVVSRAAWSRVGGPVAALVGLGAAGGWVTAFWLLAADWIWLSIVVFFGTPAAAVGWSQLAAHRSRDERA